MATTHSLKIVVITAQIVVITAKIVVITAEAVISFNVAVNITFKKLKRRPIVLYLLTATCRKDYRLRGNDEDS